MTSVDLKRVLHVVSAVVFLDMLGFGLIVPLLPFFIEEMGGSPATVGLLFASFSAAQLVATPVLGRLSDRVGRRRVILISVAGNVAAMLVFALATNLRMLPLLFASRILAGLTSGNLAACQAAIADVAGEGERPRAMGRIGAAIGLGMIVGPVLGGVLEGVGSAAPPLAAAVIAACGWMFAWWRMPETLHRAKDDKTKGVPLQTVLARSCTVFVLLLFFTSFLVLANLQVALALLAKERMSWGEREVGYLFGLFGVVSLVVQGGLIGPLSRRASPLTLIACGSAGMVASFLAVAAAHDVFTLIAGLAILGVSLGVVQPSLSTLASEVAPREQRGAVLGFAQSAGGLARTVGPVAAGFLAEQISVGAPFVGGAAVSAISVALTYLVRRTRR